MKRLGKEPETPDLADHIHLERAQANYLRMLLESAIAQAKEKAKSAVLIDSDDDTSAFIQLSLAAASTVVAYEILGQLTNPCDCL